MLRLHIAAVTGAVALLALTGCGTDSASTATDDPSESSVEAPSDTPTAAPGSLSDPTGDVRVDGEDVARPEATVNTDLTGLTATYDGQQLVVTLTYAEPVDPEAVDDFYAGFVVDATPDARGGKIEVVRLQGEGRVVLSDSEDAQGGCGSSVTDDGAGSVTMTIPAECFGAPATVSVGNAYATSAKEFDGEWVIDTVGTEAAYDGPMVEAAPA